MLFYHEPERQQAIWHIHHHSLIQPWLNCCLYTNVKISRRDAPFSLYPHRLPTTNMPQLDDIIDISSFTFLTNSVLFLLVIGSIIYPLPQIENPGISFDSFSLLTPNRWPSLQLLIYPHPTNSMTITLLQSLMDSCPNNSVSLLSGFLILPCKL